MTEWLTRLSEWMSEWVTKADWCTDWPWDWLTDRPTHLAIDLPYISGMLTAHCFWEDICMIPVFLEGYLYDTCFSGRIFGWYLFLWKDICMILVSLGGYLYDTLCNVCFSGIVRSVRRKWSIHSSVYQSSMNGRSRQIIGTHGRWNTTKVIIHISTYQCQGPASRISEKIQILYISVPWVIFDVSIFVYWTPRICRLCSNAA